MKRLGSRVNLIPVIAKADTLTPKDLQSFKKRASLSKTFHHYLSAFKTNSQTGIDSGSD